jgi:hypothetical protein
VGAFSATFGRRKFTGDAYKKDDVGSVFHLDAVKEEVGL